MTPRLTPIAVALVLLALALPATAQEDDPLAEHLWVHRPLVIFADTDRDPRLQRQLASLEAQEQELDARDVVVIVDTTPGPSRSKTTALRKKFRPHGFTVILVGKDGEVKIRRPQVITGGELLRLIDRLPLRQQELGRR